MRIPFNKPYLTGKETHYLYQAVQSGKISGDGMFTKKCHRFFEQRYGFKHCLLTSSCTDALEMAALLLDLRPGDEVIVPSFAFVSTANAFMLRGAKIVFADSAASNPNIDVAHIESLITDKTKAVVVIHYAGIACDMDRLMKLAETHNFYVVEDAAHAIDSFYKNRPLGGIGHLATFSFHETKNIISGEGGMLVVNDENFYKRAEIVREKGTNRSAFFRGEVDKYRWVDIGSSFLPSDIIAAFLYAQLENLEKIQTKRKKIWKRYFESLKPLEDQGHFRLPFLPEYAMNNGHLFYLVLHDEPTRQSLIQHLKAQDILCVFHYNSLHKSPFYLKQAQAPTQDLPWSDCYTDCLLRLPLYYELTESKQDDVVNGIIDFFQNYEPVENPDRQAKMTL